ncbi:MAG: DUF3298 domain-containing protein [Bacteroidota bacterium]
MKIFCLLAIVAISTNTRAQNNAISWNKVLTGVIGNYPATMYLQKTGKSYNGYYYYDSKQIPMRLMDFESKEDSLHIVAFGQENSEYFDGTYNAGAFSGTWRNTAAEKMTSLSFSFTESKTIPPPYFDVVYTTYDTEYPIGLEKGRNPSYSYFASALWPVSSTPAPLAGFLKKWVNQQFGNRNPAISIGKFFVDEKNKDLASWKRDLASMKKSEIKEYAGSKSLSSERRHTILYQSDTYISIADFSWSFTGGAHGNGGTSMSVLDIKNLKALKLADVFTPTGKQKLAALLDAAVRAKFNIAKGAKLRYQDGGVLLVSKIEPTDNFYITGKGVGFNYVPYEIAAYAVGEITLFLPYDKLKGLLQRAFAK